MAHYQLLNALTNDTIASELDSNQRPYYLLQSGQYGRNCQFLLIVSNADTSSGSTRRIPLRANRNSIVEPSKIYQDVIRKRKKRRYGIKITQRDLPVLVRLIPNQNYEKMDVDLYAYTEQRFTSYYFPNRAERNHVNNYMEQLLITAEDAYFIDNVWHFFEVYGSNDSEQDVLDYQLEVELRYDPNSLLKKILLIFAFTIAFVFITAICCSFVCLFRHQLMFCLRIRASPHPNGAAKRHIKRLKIITYKAESHASLVDSNQCIICLEEYQESDRVRILKCQHCFHKHCSDEWFYINNKCPLCNQEIANARNVHNAGTHNAQQNGMEIELAQLHPSGDEEEGAE